MIDILMACGATGIEFGASASQTGAFAASPSSPFRSRPFGLQSPSEETL